MERGSNKHGAREDDALKQGTESMVRSGRPPQREEWNEPEPPADDDPALAQGVAPEQQSGVERRE